MLGLRDMKKKIITHGFYQVALSMVKKSETQEREMARMRDHQQLIDMIADLREEVRQRRLITSEAPPPRETIPQVSLVWHNRVHEGFNAWQTQVMELDVQGGVQASSSSRPPKSAADCECFKTLSWIITHFPVNHRFREGFQS